MPLSVPLGRLSRAEHLLRNTPITGPASLPVPNPTKSFWLDSQPDNNPLAHEGSKGQLTSDSDVCIIGSGISGTCAAFHLSKLSRGSGKPVDVVVLEAREFCACFIPEMHFSSNANAPKVPVQRVNLCP